MWGWEAVSCFGAALRLAISCCWWNWVRARRRVRGRREAAAATSVRISPYACFQPFIIQLTAQSMATRTRLMPRKLKKFVGSGMESGSREGDHVRAKKPAAAYGRAQPRLNQAAAER